MSNRTFLFCSDIALYPPQLRVVEIICREHSLAGHVFAPLEFSLPAVYNPTGKLTIRDLGTASSLCVHLLPTKRGDVTRFGFDKGPHRALLRKINPDYIWIHGEFWEGIAHQVLRHYRFETHPRIIAFVAVNHIEKSTPLIGFKFPFISRTRLKHKFLWSRLNGVVACATKSMSCARRLGLPNNVPVTVNYLPVFGPEESAEEGVVLPWSKDGSFTVGFAGQIIARKGWKVLLAAVERLPERFKVVLVGDGDQIEELEACLKRPGLTGRAYYAGLLPKNRLLATYPHFDTFVLPSITTPAWEEQFGAVLAEAMACGVPVIGSDSGAIPETIGQAGLTFPEGDSEALSQVILRMSQDEDLRQRYAAWGRERYRTHYSCEAYARSIAKALKIS